MPKTKTDKPATTLQTVDRALTFLEVLSDATLPMRLRDVADAMGINITTGYHLLNTLMHRGYVVRAGDGTLQIGSRVGLLHRGLMRHFSQGTSLRDALETLSASTGETCYLTALSREGVVIQLVSEGTHAVSVRGLRVGYSGAEHVRASAKAVLAHLDEEAWRPVIDRAAGQLGQRRSAQLRHDLRDEFERIRKDGWALDDGQFDEGVRCVAAAYFDFSGAAQGSIALSAPALRFAANAEQLTQAVITASQQISHSLGFETDDQATNSADRSSA